MAEGRRDFPPKELYYGDGLWVVTGDSTFNGIDSTVTMTSTDSLGWNTGLRSGVGAFAFPEDVHYAAGRWVMSSPFGRHYTSTTGLGSSWAEYFQAENAGYYAVAYGNGRWVMVGSNGIVLSTSNPASTPWTLQTDDQLLTLHDVGFGAGRFVAVGKTGTIATTTDFLSLAEPTSSTFSDLNAVWYGGGRWVAVGDSGTILTSANGLSWQAASGTGSSDFNDVSYGDGRWLAVGASGALYESSDGVSWSAASSPTSLEIKAIHYADSKWVMLVRGASYTGTIANDSPSLSITSPSEGAVFPPPAEITLSATATDTDGTVTKVEFYQNGVKIGEDTSGPNYTFNVSSLGVGSYRFSAQATDDRGASSVERSVNVTVEEPPNVLPTVSITFPANNGEVQYGDSVFLTVAAEDSDGTVTKVEFLNYGFTILGEDTTGPEFRQNLSTLKPGRYLVSARATDDDGGVKISSEISFSVLHPNQPPTAFSHDWTVTGGGAEWDHISNVATHVDGRTYVLGWAGAGATFGEHSVTSAAGSAFLASVSMSGSYEWVTRIGNTNAVSPWLIELDADGNPVVAGTYFGEVEIGQTALTNAGGLDAFVAKLNANGQVQWVRRAGSTFSEQVGGLAVNATGDIYLAGSFENSIELGDFPLTSVGSSDVFVAKYDSEGNVVWAGRGGGSSGPDGVFDADVDGSGNLLLVGTFSSPADFGPQNLQSAADRTSAGVSPVDAYLAKVSAAGEFVWVSTAHFNHSGTGWAGVKADASDNVFVFGGLLGEAAFAQNSITNSQADVSSPLPFAVKFDPAGNDLWATIASAGAGVVYDVEPDNVGGVYVGGTFWDSLTMGGTEYLSAGSQDAFVARMSSDGEITWLERMGGLDRETLYSMGRDSSGAIYFAGEFDPRIQLPGTTKDALGFSDIFVTKISGAGLVFRSPRTRLRAPVMSAAGFDFEFNYLDSSLLPPGRESFFEIHWSEDLVTWTTNTSIPAVQNGTIKFKDSGAAGKPRRFYRVIER